MKKQRLLVTIICTAAAVLIAAIAVFALTQLDGEVDQPKPSATPSVTPPPSALPDIRPTVPDSPEPVDPSPEQTPEVSPDPSPVPSPEASPVPTEDIPPEPSPEPEQPQPEEYTISFVGTVSLPMSAEYEDIFEPIRELLASDDVSIANIGNICGGTSEGASTAETLGGMLRTAGVDIVNLAASGISALDAAAGDEAISAVSGQGLPYITDRDIALLISRNDLLIGFYASDGGAGSNMKQCIATLEGAGADIIIVCLSWNNGTTELYMSNEYHSAHYAIDCGADIVFGQNGAQLHYLEEYGGGLIIYGLGEYISEGNTAARAAVLQLTFSKDDSGYFVSGTACVPISSGSNTTPPNAFLPGSEEYAEVIHTINNAPSFSAPERRPEADEAFDTEEAGGASEPSESANKTSEVQNDY